MAEDVQPTYVRFPVDLHAQVKAYAAANDLTMAQVIRSAVREKLTPSPAGVTFDFVNREVRPGLPPPPDPPPSASVSCPHPKKTRGDSGLVKCDDCGKVNP